MKVAILGSRGYPSTYSGYETLVRHLAPGLRDLGWDVTVYCRPGDVSRPPHLRVDETDGISRTWTRGVDGKSTSTLSHGLTSMRDAAHRDFDVALVLNVANGYFLRFLKRAGVRTVVNVDGLEWERDKWNAAGKAVFRYGARLVAHHADAIVADSRAIGDYWQRVFGRSSVFIPYGADIHDDVPNDRLHEVGVDAGAYVLVIARIVPENNVEVFLDAVPLLHPRTPVVIVGSAVGRSRLQLRLQALAGTRPAFRWLGHVSDQELLRQLRAHCGAYWHGHSVGGTNPSLLEAMACGAPVVAVDTPYNREVLRDAAQLCHAEATQIASALTALLTDEGRRGRVASSQREIVARHYRWSDVCSDYASLLAAPATISHRR